MRIAETNRLVMNYTIKITAIHNHLNVCTAKNSEFPEFFSFLEIGGPDSLRPR
jgi:hypothetical protein